VFLEATNQLRESPEFELYELTAKNAEMFEEVVSKQTALLEKQRSGSIIQGNWEIDHTR